MSIDVCYNWQIRWFQVIDKRTKKCAFTVFFALNNLTSFNRMCCFVLGHQVNN